MKYCPKCGNKYPNAMAFCTADGAALGDTTEAQTLRMNPTADPLEAIRIMGDISKTIPARVEYIFKKVWVDEGDTFLLKASTNVARITVAEIVEDEFISGVFSDEKKKEYG